MSDDRFPRDHADEDYDETRNEAHNEPPAEPRIGEHVKSKSTWLRLLFMIVMMLLYSISRLVVGAVILLQFLYALLSGAPHAPLTRFGRSLAAYTYEIVLYLTYNTEARPFPFDNEWPAADAPVGQGEPGTRQA